MKKLKFTSKITLFIFCIIVIFSSFTYLKLNSKNEKFYYNFVESYISYRNSKSKINPDTNILILSNLKEDNKQITSVCFVNPELLINTKYNNVYGIGDYKLIITNENITIEFSKAKYFKNLNYENFNKAKYSYTYNITPWTISIDKRNRITEIFPQKDTIIIRKLLQEKKIKFK